MDPPFGIIDDSDPSIRYVGAWKQGGSAQEYLSTTHGASQAGLHAVLTFSGSYVAVYGTIGAKRRTVVASYALDDSTPVTNGDALISTSAIQYRQRFYESPRLKNGQHKLNITLETNDIMFWLDYFHTLPDIAPPPPPPTTDLSSQPQGTLPPPIVEITRTEGVAATTTIPPVTLFPSLEPSTPSLDTPSELATTLRRSNFKDPSAAATSILSTTSLAPSPSAEAALSSKGASNGALAGGVIGGVIFLLCILAFVWLRHKRKSKAIAVTPRYPVDAENFHATLRQASWELPPQSAIPSLMSEAANFNPFRMVRPISTSSYYPDGPVYSPQYGYSNDAKPFY